MKSICSMKTISAIFLAFMLMLGTDMALSSSLTEQENKWLNSYLSDKHSRPAVRMAFWMDMRDQVEEMVATLPYLVHDNIALVGIKYNELTSISYTYFVNNPTIDLTNVKPRMVEVLCQDPQTLLYLVTMEGDFTYNYFLYGDVSALFYSINISSNDCGVGI